MKWWNSTKLQLGSAGDFIKEFKKYFGEPDKLSGLSFFDKASISEVRRSWLRHWCKVGLREVQRAAWTAPNFLISALLKMLAHRMTKNKVADSGVARPKISEGPKNFGGGQMLDFRLITLFWLEKCLSKHKITIFSKNFGGAKMLDFRLITLFYWKNAFQSAKWLYFLKIWGGHGPPGYAYGSG